MLITRADITVQAAGDRCEGYQPFDPSENRCGKPWPRLTVRQSPRDVQSISQVSPGNTWLCHEEVLGTNSTLGQVCGRGTVVTGYHETESRWDPPGGHFVATQGSVASGRRQWAENPYP